MDFQLRGHVFENLRDIFTDAVLGAPAAIADFLFGRQIQFVSVVRETGEVEFPTAATSMPGNLLTRLLGVSNRGNFDIARRRQIEQVPLAFPIDNSLTPPSVHPAFVPGEFFKLRGEFLLQFCMRVRRRIQDAVQFGDLPLRFGDTLRRFCCLSFKLNGLPVGS